MKRSRWSHLVHPLPSRTYDAEQASVTSRHVGQHGAPAIRQTMQIGDNYLNDGHLPPERPQTHGCDRVPQCHPSHPNKHAVSQQSRLTPGVAVSFEVPDGGLRRELQRTPRQRRPPYIAYIADSRGGRHGCPVPCVVVCDFNVVHAAYYFLTKSISAICNCCINNHIIIKNGITN